MSQTLHELHTLYGTRMLLPCWERVL